MIHKKKKTIIWCLFSAQQILIIKILQLIDINAQTLNQSLKYSERRELINRFQNDIECCNVLVCSYFMKVYDLNLQQQCHNVHLFNSSPFTSIEKQTIDRCRRVDQRYYVRVFEYYLRHSFNDRQVFNNLRKTLLEMMTELNTRLLREKDEDEKDANQLMQLNQWIRYNEQLIRLNDVFLHDKDSKAMLNSQTLIKVIMNDMRNEIVVIDESTEFSWLKKEINVT